jgi:hypothetical protein
MLPAWAAIDVDDAIVALFVWISVHSACLEEAYYVRRHLVRLIWEKKLGRQLDTFWGAERDFFAHQCTSFWIRPRLTENPVAEHLLQ